MPVDVSTPWPFLITAVFIAVVGWYAGKQSPRPGTRCFAWLTRIWFLAALAAGAANVASSSDIRYWLWAAQILIMLLQAPLTLMFSLEYAGYDQLLTRRNLALLAVPALAFVALVVILPRDQLASARIYSGREIFVGGDLVVWGAGIFHFGVWLAGLAVLVQCFANAPAYRLPTTILIAAQLLPRVVYLAVQQHGGALSPSHSAILVTSVTSVLYLVALQRFQLFQVSPVARDTAINYMPYGVLVLDQDNRLVEFNPAAQALLGLPARRPSRQAAVAVLGDWWERLAPFISPEPVSRDIAIQTAQGSQIFHVSSLPLRQASGWKIGQVLIIEDVTQAREAQRQQAQILWVHATGQEREQLAHELHDGLSQNLAFLNVQAQAAQVYLHGGQTEAADAALMKLVQEAQQIQHETRALIGDLLALSQPAENFGTSLRQIQSRFEQHTGLPLTIDLNGSAGGADGLLGPSRLHPSVAVQLVRITQEALANVRKHAGGAQSVSIKLEARDDRLCMTIADDGPGFKAADVPSTGKHFGLQVMRQRAARVGGQVTVNSEPGKGTRVEVCVPLASDEMRISE